MTRKHHILVVCLIFICVTFISSTFARSLAAKENSNDNVSNSEKSIRIVIVGDSTACEYGPEVLPRKGWGQMFQQFFSKEVFVINHASSGRSSKSFIDEGLWDIARNDLRTADYLFIQFGHNDEKRNDPARYTEPYTTYKQHLTRYIMDARAKGANPVLLTPVSRRKFDTSGKLKWTHGEYPAAMIQLAQELNVPLIDVCTKSETLFNSLGDEKTKELFLYLKPGENPNYPNGVQDDTHFQEYGAIEIGNLVINGLKELNHPLVRYLQRDAVYH